MLMAACFVNTNLCLPLCWRYAWRHTNGITGVYIYTFIVFPGNSDKPAQRCVNHITHGGTRHI